MASLPVETFLHDPCEAWSRAWRIAPRNLFDLSVGDDDLFPFHNDTYKWSLRFTVINVTNNAWYGDSTAPHQHLQIARMRALEAGRFLVRAANDGITAVIDSQGKIAARLPQFQEGVLRADVQPMTGLTPYARLGNYPVVLGALGCLAIAVWRRRRA